MARPFPSTTPHAAARASALRGRIGGLSSLYALVPVPLLTDWIENGALPSTARGWITEIAGGLVIAALVTRVRRDRRALDKLARYDGLTGLANGRAFEAALDAESARARRSLAPLSIVYLDVDRFEAINDRFGHGGDGGYRLGGDEFALVLPATTKGQAETVVARIRSFCALHDARWAVGAFGLSAGIVEFDRLETATELLSRSDTAMYREKKLRHSTGA